jgi:hypothetical protein
MADQALRVRRSCSCSCSYVVACGNGVSTLLKAPSRNCTRVSGLKMLVRSFVLPTSLADLWSAPRLRGRLFGGCNDRTTSFVGQAVLVLESLRTECWSTGGLECCAFPELHLAAGDAFAEPHLGRVRLQHTRCHLPTSRLHRLSERASIFLHDLLSLSTSVITALVISRRPNLHRLVPLDHVDQGLLPMKQLLGGTHRGL